MLLLALIATGCDHDEIQRYRVKRFEPARSSTAAMSPQRMLAAIIPQGEQSWFLKLMGPVAEVSEQHEAFQSFVHSIRLEESGEKPITWTVPEGWHEHAGSGMRYAEFHIGPHSADPLQLTVSRAGGSVLANVNRWRGQIGLGPIDEEELGKTTTEMDLQGVTATVVDMTGTGGGAGTGPSSVSSGASPRSASTPPSLHEQKPEGWTETTHPLGMPLPAYRVADGDAKADITVTIAGGDLAANVNRWRTQVGLSQVGADSLGGQEIDIGGTKADYFDLRGPESSGPQRQRILGAVAVRDGLSWFFKMRGPDTLVEQQKPIFEAWLESVHFDAAENDEGGADG